MKTTGDPSGLLARSVIPVVSVTVAVPAPVIPVGVNVHTRPPMLEARVPATALPLLTMNVDDVTFMTGSLNVTAIGVFAATFIAPSAGIVD
jgi:hypothetical protein